MQICLEFIQNRLVIENEPGRDDQYKEESDHVTREKISDRKKIIVAIEWTIYTNVKKRINIIWNNAEFIRKGNDNY
jgi:hypothetical protein